ncbi:hypothetical protein EDB85DRAFT_1888795 [Lactarius pseudohatsudake]|nr:hypothetical protein EDB85DRAFT_1888795 [Lactarius pseudohatsudake]
MHSFADLIRVEVPNPELRDMSLVKCRYVCADSEPKGAAYREPQMLSYETPLDLKRNVLKARQSYSNLLYDRQFPPLFNMAIAPIITSHLQPPAKKGNKMQGPSTSEGGKPPWLKIGFIQIRKRVMMDTERPELAHGFLPQSGGTQQYSGTNSPTTTGVKDSYVCIADHKATVWECIGDLLFGDQEGSFSRMKSLCLVASPRTFATPSSADPLRTLPPAPTHLLDAYRGAGLFSLTFAPHFTEVAGIGLSPDAIRFATHNTELDALAYEVFFRSGERRADLQRTALVVGSPCKGCDAFVRRLPAPCADGRVVTYTCRGRRGDRVVGRGGREIRPGNLTLSTDSTRRVCCNLETCVVNNCMGFALIQPLLQPI